MSRGSRLCYADIVDLLLTAYHVLYLEASDEVALVKTVSDACAKLHRKIGLPVLGGHRNSEAISLGHGRRAFNPTSGQLGVEVQHLLSLLAPSIEAGGKIVLFSCSKAGGINGADHVAFIVHLAIPHAHVFAPQSDTAVDIRLNEAGWFERLEFHCDQQVYIDPTGKVETESLMASRTSDAQLIAQATLRNAFNDPV